MPTPKTKSTVVKGVLYPSHTDVKSVVASIQRRVKADRKTAAQFKKNPRSFLASAGLNEDVQRELLGEMGMKAASRLSWCICTDCCKTCWCTACCITDVNITNYLPR
jgi:hypothetical protein